MNPRDWTMERKIGASTFAIALAAIAVLSVFLIISEQATMRASQVRFTQTLVGMIANNAAASLLYRDEAVAEQILAGAAAEASTQVAALYTEDGKLYAWYPAALARSALPANASGLHTGLQQDWLDVHAPVMLQGRKVGTAYLRTNLLELRRSFHVYLWTVAAVAFVTILLLALLARAIQRWISLPIRSLSATAQRIAAQRDYTLRADKLSGDEVGSLVDSFNAMVQEIESAHEAIQRHASRLESEVAERTANLAAMVNELESFSYSISHDMRGPLRAIVGYGELLTERISPEDGESRQYLDRLVRASRRMDSLIIDILNYSRIAKGEMQVEPVDLDTLTDDVINEYPQFAGANFTIARPLGSVLGHKAALGQVLSNLLGNAIKFMPADRQPAVKVWSERIGQERRIWVEDNGIGIEPDDLARLFRIFQRVGDQSRFAGTGVGLSIVKKAVEKMGGRVGAESVVQQGSKFWFILPVPAD